MKKKYLNIAIIIVTISLIITIFLGYLNSKKNSTILFTKNSLFSSEAKINKNFIYKKLYKNSKLKFMLIGNEIPPDENSPAKGNSWFYQFADYLEKEYRLNINKQVLTATNATVLESWTDYFKNNTPEADITFICLGQNDQNRVEINQFSSIYEALIRTIKTKNPHGEIAMVIENSLTQNKNLAHSGMYINAIKNLALKYNTLIVDTINESKVSNNFTGNKLYFKTIVESFNKRKTDIADGNTTLSSFNSETKSLFSHSEKFLTCKKIDSFFKTNGFLTKEIINSETMIKDSVPGKYIIYKFDNSSILMLSAQVGPNCGIANMYIDGNFINTIDLYSPIKSKVTFFLADNLNLNPHDLKLEVTKNKNNLSTGYEIGILGLITNSEI